MSFVNSHQPQFIAIGDDLVAKLRAVGPCFVPQPGLSSIKSNLYYSPNQDNKTEYWFQNVWNTDSTQNVYILCVSNTNRTLVMLAC